MLLKQLLAGIILSSACLIPATGQQADSVLLKDDPYLAELDSLLALGDSLNILSWVDSLINLEDEKVRSQLISRIGYNSNIVSASRTLGINQFGLSPGFSYYHKSGLYADITSYWSKEYEPDLYLTVGSVGYMSSPTKWWSLMGEYNRYMYTDAKEAEYIAYKNSVGVSNFFDVNILTFRLDYQFYFGDKQAHRINPSIMLNLEKKNLGKITRISFFPTFSLLMGSEQISYYVPYTTRLIGIIYRLRNGLPLYYLQNETKFGILNYSFVAPITINLKKWYFTVSYTYNIPKALPGETINLVDSGYLSASVSRRITF